MADEIDQAQDQIEASLRTAVRLAQRQPRLAPTGSCHNCGSLLPRGLLWCDSACREDYDRAQAAQQRNGRPRR